MASSSSSSSSLFLSPPFASHSATQSPQPSNLLQPRLASAKVLEKRLDQVTTDFTFTRRFGITSGLALFGSIAFSKQIEGSLQVIRQEATASFCRDIVEEEVVLPNGIRYFDLRGGRGPSRMAGDVMMINVKGSVAGSGQVFVDTNKKKKAVSVVLMGSRPYDKGICEGVEYVMRNMKAGGIRRVTIPPSLGFGEKGADFGEGLQIPPSSTLEYVIQVQNVFVDAPYI